MSEGYRRKAHHSIGLARNCSCSCSCTYQYLSFLMRYSSRHTWKALRSVTQYHVLALHLLQTTALSTARSGGAVVGKARTVSVYRSIDPNYPYHQRMSLTCAKRLRKEMHKLQTSPPDEDIRLCADEDDFRQWKAHIRGPPDTPFAGGKTL